MLRGQHSVFREQRGHRPGQLPAVTRGVPARVRTTPHVRVLDLGQGGATWPVLPEDGT